MKSISASLLTVAAAAALLTACQSTPPPNRGMSGGRLDPTHESPSELGVLDLRSADLVTATDQMAQDIAQRLDVVDPNNPTRIVVGRIENRTSRPEQTYQIFLARLRSELNSSGSRHGLHFVRERAFVERERDREFSERTQPELSSRTYASDAEYVLTAEVYDMPRGRTNYFLVDFQLVQLVDTASTSSGEGGGHIVWENNYEMKFQ